jgi:CRISPR-associated protein Cas1
MTILTTHKYGIEYLEHCSVRAADEQLVFVRRKDAVQQHFNIPVLNTAVLLLGPGTSITQQAARLCAEGNVLLGFAAGGGTPLYMAAINEYREPKYSRAWISMWEDEEKRLVIAKQFQQARVALIKHAWANYPEISVDPSDTLTQFLANSALARNTMELLSAEGQLTKELYGLLAKQFGVTFTRKPKTKDFANEYLDAGNYLAYGLAACCLWVLGIPYSYPLMHGKTRRGALVFDVADLVKDALIMPAAFIAAAKGEPANVCRKRMLSNLHDRDALGLMFKEVLKVTDC